ncbi:hypothetical protein [Mesorhizobium sp. M0847]|uniref:hypothetical protein n=1 Tax=unclassified Mesorhizobium TaxID=325217 RepID=UPI003335A0BC
MDIRSISLAEILGPVLVGNHHQRAGARRLLHQRHPEEIVETVGFHPLAHDAAFEPVLAGVRALQGVDAIDGERHVDFHLRHRLEEGHLAGVVALQRLKQDRIAAGSRKPGRVSRRIDDRQHGKPAERQFAD